MDNPDPQKFQKMASLSNDGQLILLNEIEDSKKSIEDKINDAVLSLDARIEEVALSIENLPKPTDYSERFNELKEKIEEPLKIEVSLNIT